MKFSFILSLLVAVVLQSMAQTTDKLAAYFPFEECNLKDSVGISTGLPIGDLQCESCGVIGNALEFNGFGDHAIIIGGISNNFETSNFSVSFYFKPVGTGGTQSLITYRDSCTNTRAFEIAYTPASGIVSVQISESDDKSAPVQGEIDFESCWQHVVFVRNSGSSILYINGKKVDTNSAVSRIDLKSNADLRLASGPCVDVTNVFFEGLMDEVRIYAKDLSDAEVRELYFAPDKIANSRDTLIYLGSSVQINNNQRCQNYSFDWFPAEDVEDPSARNALITPKTHGVHLYSVMSNDETYGCTAYDSILIRVVDPDSLDCNKIFVPKAFTPDGLGPQENNTFGLSNPFAVRDLISLEIFDRWGNRVFFTDDPFATWDGRFKSKNLNPGVFLWRIRYLCKAKELVEVGSLTLIR